jgi:hypothetical protein
MADKTAVLGDPSPQSDSVPVMPYDDIGRILGKLNIFFTHHKQLLVH